MLPDALLLDASNEALTVGPQESDDLPEATVHASAVFDAGTTRLGQVVSVAGHKGHRQYQRTVAERSEADDPWQMAWVSYDARSER